MANYKWVTLISGKESEEKKPVFALIAPAGGFYGSLGQQKIKERLELLTSLGFEVKIPVFSLDENGEDITSLQEKINFDVAEQRSAFGQMQVVIEPNVQGREEPEFPILAPFANSPQTGANLIIDCIKNGWNMMPLAGGNSFQDKLPYVKRYFAEHPNDKNPEVNIFGYSNITWANSLMLDGICSYYPTQLTNNFTKIADIKAKQQKNGLNKGEEEWLVYLESQAEKLKSVLTNPVSVREGDRKVIFNPPPTAKSLEGNAMHYPLNIDVFTGLESDPNLFMPNPKEKWSFAIEWMMQRGDNPSVFSNAVELLDKFLARNINHLPEFIEIGVLGTRFDGLNGLWDLIYDEKGDMEISDANMDIILSREPIKQGFVKKLNEFLSNYKNCSDEDKKLHGVLPNFLQNKLDHNLNKIASVDGNISREEVGEIFKWRNEVFQRVLAKVTEVAEKYNLPLVLNSSYGHVANMSPNVSGPCEYRFDGANLNLRRLEDRSLTASLEDSKADGLHNGKKPGSSVEAATVEKHKNIRSKL
ncbi:MAG: hypothetical protein K0R25_743 [Rickettsiaceae bacterium]|jgi:muramoyltetrapeptide carboxypeptidase LdcA involved in peptidoglycan recycling|nr:hypothetical protein [Rickettsiaceae bacterium]